MVSGTRLRSEWTARDSRKPPRTRAMNAQELLQEISDYCRQTGLAESTFGRRAVNDGKLASRLRHGGRITTETLDRIRSFMTNNNNVAARPTVIPRTFDRAVEGATAQLTAPRAMPAVTAPMLVPRGAPVPSPSGAAPGGPAQGGPGAPDPQR